MKRLFLTIKITPDDGFLDQLHLVQNQLTHEKIKWVEEHNIHITLKFFGETEEAKIPLITQILQEIAAGTSGFSFSLKKLGVFGSSYDPRVVWAGIEPFAEIASLMNIIRNNMGAAGFEADRQNVVPHLTLGRIKLLKDKSLFQKVMDQNREISSVEMVVDRYILFESILKKEGPVYVALQSFRLRT